jgi:CubicO group peptidase (beta-lactamase class C family)
MTLHRRKITRRAALTGLGGLAAAAQTGVFPSIDSAPEARGQDTAPPPGAAIPIRGKAGPGLEPFDAAMLSVMDRHGVPGAALALAKDGKLVLAKGFGWSDISRNEAVQPNTLFSLASLSKSFTAVGVLKLVEQGKLSLDDAVFDILKHIKAPRGARIDPRLGDVTVRQCLNHSGGWDRAVRGDPVNWEPQICRAYKVRPPLSPTQFLSFAMSLPLDFKPGTDNKYSNVGYIALGEVVARVSGQPYETFVRQKVLKPMGITQAALHPGTGRYMAKEAIRYLAGTLLSLPAMRLPMVDATGGWTASVVDMVRFLTNLDGSRGESVLSGKTRKLMIEPPREPLKPRPDGTWFGLGWDSVIVKGKEFGFFKEGSYQGMRTYMKRLPTGVCWALLYNASMEFDPQDRRAVAATVHEVRQLVERVGKYPDIDLFKEFP